MLPSSSAPETIKHSGLFPLLQMVLTLAGIAALFCLLTSIVPLVQLGWVSDLGKKTRYVRPAMISTALFAALMILARWKLPQFFERTLPVRLWRAICSIPTGILVTFLFILYATIMTILGFERQAALETRAFDLGIFAQAVWNTMQGDFLFSSIKENICLLGDHVSPILVLLVPFYKIWADPRMLVLIQAVAAASCLFPLAYLVRDKLKDNFWVVIFLLLYCLYYPTRAALLEDFHPEVLIEVFLFLAFIFLEKRKTWLFILCALIAASAKENILGIIFMLGFYALVFKRMWALGALTMLGSAGLFMWETKWLVPFLTGQKYFYGGNYSTMLANPVTGILQPLLEKGRLTYAFKVFLPFLFLPFLHLPTFLLTWPIFFQNLLSGNPTMRSFNYHYSTGLTPFLFISTIYALASLREKFTWVKKYFVWIGFALLFIGILRSGPSAYYFFWKIHGHRSPHTEMIREQLRTIPPDVTVLTHNSFVPQLCDRKHIYQFNYSATPSKADFAERYQADYVIWDTRFWEPRTEPPAEALRSLKKDGFVVQFDQDGFIILKREA